MTESEEVVRLSCEETQQILATSYSTWSSRAIVLDALKPESVQLRNVLGPVPSYLAYRLSSPRSIDLKLEHKLAKDNIHELFASGTSQWRTCTNDNDTGVKTIHYHLLRGIQTSTPCCFSTDQRFLEWPGIQNHEDQQKGNYIAVLAFAWAYILSSRWIEIQEPELLSPGSGSGSGMQYSQEQAGWIHNRENVHTFADDIKIDIGNVEEKAARWWAAILANGEGYQATIVCGGKIYRSPWSICFSSRERFQLQRCEEHTPTSTSILPPSSQEALLYLSDFCLLHNIRSQSSAALAACLHIPFLRGTTINLPLTKPYPNDPRSRPAACQAVFDEAELLDYYMTLSCNVWGIRALLCGTFYNPEIPCNGVSPWLEPALEITSSIVGERQYVRLATLMCNAQPKLAPLWLGAILTGGEKQILSGLRSGLSAVELHAAAWTDTAHSFIGPWSHSAILISNSAIRRSDEARLLFLTGSEGFSRSPVCPWRPFGYTPIKDTDIEVRQHAHCNGHCLEYASWLWDTVNYEGNVLEDKGFSSHLRNNQVRSMDLELSPPHQNIGLRSEELSEAATRSIFGWLRVNGFAAGERAISSHEWFDIETTDEELDPDNSRDDISRT